MNKFWASVLVDNVAMSKVFKALGRKSSKGGQSREKLFEVSVETIIRRRKSLLEKKGIEKERS